ncbi:MAG: ATP-binding protein [Lewinellaceae bacterium]|nr:ATP-binding protein [Lewinellaceae bacterium]
MEETNDKIKANARSLEKELQWFRQVLDTRLKLYFGQEAEYSDIYEIEPPAPVGSDSNWAAFLAKYQPGVEERLALLLGLVPYIEPRLLDVFFTKNAQYDRPFSEFGGLSNGQHKGFIPTGETLLFLLAANHLDRRFGAMRLFHPDHYFAIEHLLWLEKGETPGLPLAGALTVSDEWVAYFTHGEALKPVFGKDFPAEEIRTQLEWTDLVLNNQTRRQIREMETWIEHGDTLLNDWGMAGKIRPGFRALFYGKPGTGKTMTACLLGKATGREVYRIDLSMVVSKYIGETEKNLARVFRQAESKGWILFFDEADALFGKRSETRSSHDRYANQEVAYLLQRIESFDGIIILASNFKENVDEAFTRRFEAVIQFPIPGVEERLRIWQQGISPSAALAPEVDLREIARRFELSGGAILNVVRYASLEALRQGGNVITMGSIQQGVRRELVKEGKVV